MNSANDNGTSLDDVYQRLGRLEGFMSEILQELFRRRRTSGRRTRTVGERARNEAANDSHNKPTELEIAAARRALRRRYGR